MSKTSIAKLGEKAENVSKTGNFFDASDIYHPTLFRHLKFDIHVQKAFDYYLTLSIIINIQ